MPSNNRIANRYEVYQHIGQGGMADVFLATDTILNRRVAIKILRSELSTDAVAVLRFEREAQAATALSHPNIVEIYDVGEYKGHHFIVMEYCPGKTLKQMIKERGPLLKEEAVDIIRQLVSATAEAHRRGIIHRDIKPQNVMVKADGSVKMLDFGIALAKGSMQLTQANNVMGSVHYLAPELAHGKAATPRSDIYALGIVLFEMLTGDVPFKAESAVQVALMQMRNEFPDMRSINPTIPQALINIVSRATAKDPDMRYRSCEAMGRDLETCLYPERENETPLQLQVTPAKTHGDSTVTQAAVTKKRSSKAAMILLTVAISLCFFVGGWFGLQALGILGNTNTDVTVPNLIGQTLADAKNIATENNLVLDTSNVSYALTTDVEKGRIISVSPDVGSSVERGSRIQVTVSSGIGVAVKDYTGMKLAEAKRDLAQYSFMKVEVQEESREDVDPGTILRQELLAPDEMFNPNTSSSIRLVYAAYPEITVPQGIVGKPIDEAVQELEDLKVQVLTSNLDTTGLSDNEIANLKTGVVISVDPQEGDSYTQREDNYVILYYY